jgi:hypothetical protein
MTALERITDASSHRATSEKCQQQTHAPQETYPYSITSSARASSVGGTVMLRGLRGLEIDDQLEFGRLHNRQVGGLSAFEDLIRVKSNL